jgi:hypothetical protein
MPLHVRAGEQVALIAKQGASCTHRSTSPWSDDDQPDSNALPLQLTPGKPTRQFLAVRDLTQPQADDDNCAAHAARFQLLDAALREEFGGIKGGFGDDLGMVTRGSTHPDLRGSTQDKPLGWESGPLQAGDKGELLQKALLERLSARKAAPDGFDFERPSSSLGSGSVAAVHITTLGEAHGDLNVHDTATLDHEGSAAIGCHSLRDPGADLANNTAQLQAGQSVGSQPVHTVPEVMSTASTAEAVPATASALEETCAVGATHAAQQMKVGGTDGEQPLARPYSLWMQRMHLESSSVDDSEIAEAVAGASWHLKQQLKTSFAGMQFIDMTLATVQPLFAWHRFRASPQVLGNYALISPHAHFATANPVL